jgi:arylsulfatase A-like enzyme
MLTSRRPNDVGVGATELKDGLRHLKRGRVTKLGDQHTTFIEVLEDSGYATMCVIGNHLASHQVNFDQGCQRYAHLKYKDGNQSDRIVDKGVTFMTEYMEDDRKSGQQTPFLLYLHFMDVHEPNEPPSPYDTMYPTLNDKPHTKKHRKWGWYKLKKPGSRGFREFKSHKVALYDGSLTFVDSQIARLVKLLEKWRLLENTVIVVTSDHGEELWDHAVFEQTYREDPRGQYGVGHGHTMFREVLEVPLVMYGAGVPSGLRVPQQVRNIDIMPTLLGLTHASTEGLKMDGIDLLDAIGHDNLEDMMAFSEDITYGYEEKCIQGPRFKYVRGKDYEFFFDKEKDPTESFSKNDKHPAEKKKLIELLDIILAGPVGAAGEPLEMTDETLEHLRYLGYIE